MSGPEFVDKEKCHYCGKEFDLNSNDLTYHLRENTEVLADLPAILGSAMQMGSIDIHEGKLYALRVKPGPCMDDVKTELIPKEHAKMMIIAELNFHESIVKRLSTTRDSVLAKIDQL